MLRGTCVRRIVGQHPGWCPVGLLEYDNNIFTDLLLTSDLKGYIHQPGYYFCIAVSPEANGTGYIINGAWMA